MDDGAITVPIEGKTGERVASIGRESDRGQSRRFALRLPVLALAAGCFVSGLNVSVLSPLVPAIGRAFGVSDATAGQLATLHACVAGLVAVLIAPWIDRFPRRMVLRVECATLLVATALSAFAPSFGWLLLGRGLVGLGGAIIAGVCFATAADLFVDARDPNRRTTTSLSRRAMPSCNPHRHPPPPLRAGGDRATIDHRCYTGLLRRSCDESKSCHGSPE